MGRCDARLRLTGFARDQLQPAISRQRDASARHGHITRTLKAVHIPVAGDYVTKPVSRDRQNHS